MADGYHGPAVWWPADHRYRHRIPQPVRDWLLDRGSLTTRIRRACGRDFSVQVLEQHYARPDYSEAGLLKLEPDRRCFIRRVYLLCGTVPVVYARTVIPLSTLSGAERRLARLGSRPLGGLLFAERGMYRDQIQISRLTRQHRLFHEALCLPGSTGIAAIWGRRSVFYLHGKGLLVNEIFLPTVGAMCSPD